MSGAAVRTIVPAGLWSAWSLHPPVIALLALAALAYGNGLKKLRRQEGEGSVRRRHVAAFYAGLAALAVALLSPLDPLAHTLFSGHMIQHLMLISIAAPLLVYGRPGLPLYLVLPDRARRWLGGVAANLRGAKRVKTIVLSPVLVVALHAVALWVWHLPSAYQAALGNDALHIAEHLSFLATAILLWILIIGPATERRLGYGPAVVVVLATSLQSGALGAILTFAGTELYPIHRPGAAAWGLSPLEDQQLAGAIMWIPQGMVYLAAMAVLLWLTFVDVEARMLRREAAQEDARLTGEEAAEREAAALTSGGQP
jgi:putative membrane protein